MKIGSVTAPITNGVGWTGFPHSRSRRGRGSCPRSGASRAGSLIPKSTPVGLDGPMPGTIALVVSGRCRPSPDRVPLGAPADRDARRIVSGGLASGRGHGFLPVLRAPTAGVGGIDGDDRDTGRVGHRGQPGAEL